MPRLTRQQRRQQRKAKHRQRNELRVSEVAIASSCGMSLPEYRQFLTSGGEAVFDAEESLFASSDLTVSEDVAPDEFKPIPYRGLAYAGGDIRQQGVPYPIVVNLSTARIAKPGQKQPLLKEHASSAAVGQHTPIITATEMRLEDGTISVPNAHSREVIAGARNQYPWQASIRGRWGRLTFLKAGAKRQLNGRTIEGPRFIADDFVWRETSVTGLGADQEGPELQIAASDGEGTMNEFEKWLQKHGLDKDSLSADELQAAETTFEAIQASAELDSDDVEDLAAADNQPAAAASPATASTQSTSETLDLDEIRATARQEALAEFRAGYVEARRHSALIDRVFGDDPCYDELRASAMEHDWDENRMQNERKLYDYEHNMPRVRARSGGARSGPNEAEIMAAAMSLAQGNISAQQLEEDFDVSQDVLNEAHATNYRGIGFHGIIRAAAVEAGIPLAHHIAPQEYPRLAEQIQHRYQFLLASGQIQASQGWSTLNLAAINENVMNRSIHGRFMRQESIIPRIAQQRPARDFRPHKAYRLYGEGFFQKLKATGEIQHLKFADTGFENEVDTTAGMVTIPRKAIANDDLNIFQQVGDGLADTAFDTRERDFCIVILDPALWRTATGAEGEPINALAAGASSVFGIAALEALTDVLKKQKDRGGKPIRKGGSRILLTQTGAMERQARVIHTSENLMDWASGTKSSKDSPKRNSMYGELENRVASDWLEHDSVTNHSSAAFFLFSDPEVQPFIQVLYLDNRQTPYVETEQAAFNVLGQQMRSYWDYGMAQIDDVGAAYSPGE
ncbi:MAG: hypothetical protein RIK87_08460 [Fuerstiella sp.]